MRRDLLLCLALAAAGCNSSNNGPSDAGDASMSDDGSYEGCPRDQPTAGTSCNTAPTTHCQYGPQCHAPTFVCDELGKWEDITNQIPPVPCPGMIPDAGEMCPKCFDMATTCPYGLTCADGGVLSTRCTAQGTWQYFCGAPDAGDDGGGDDGGAEAATDAGGG